MVNTLDKEDLRIALRISLAQLNIPMHPSKLKGLVNHIMQNLKVYCSNPVPQ